MASSEGCMIHGTAGHDKVDCPTFFMRVDLFLKGHIHPNKILIVEDNQE